LEQKILVRKVLSITLVLWGSCRSGLSWEIFREKSAYLRKEFSFFSERGFFGASMRLGRFHGGEVLSRENRLHSLLQKKGERGSNLVGEKERYVHQINNKIEGKMSISY